jgi:hypothetical protein
MLRSASGRYLLSRVDLATRLVSKVILGHVKTETMKSSAVISGTCF